jgi:hypothetical protein
MRAKRGQSAQLAAYCLLVEERFGRPIRRGKLQYQNKTLDIPLEMISELNSSTP